MNKTEKEQLYGDYIRTQEYFEETQETLLRYKDELGSLNRLEAMNEFEDMRVKAIRHNQKILVEDARELEEELEAMEELYGNFLNYCPEEGEK